MSVQPGEKGLREVGLKGPGAVLLVSDRMRCNGLNEELA